MPPFWKISNKRRDHHAANYFRLAALLKRWKENFGTGWPPAMGFDTPPRPGVAGGPGGPGAVSERYGWLRFHAGGAQGGPLPAEPLARREKALDQHRREPFEELGWQYVCTVRKLAYLVL